RQRLQNDIETLGENIKDDFSRAWDGVVGASHDPAEVVNAHPYSSVAVGLAAGALLGSLPGIGGDRRPSPKQDREANSASFVAGVVGIVGDTVGSALRSEAASLARSAAAAAVDAGMAAS